MMPVRICPRPGSSAVSTGGGDYLARGVCLLKNHPVVDFLGFTRLAEEGDLSEVLLGKPQWKPESHVVRRSLTVHMQPVSRAEPAVVSCSVQLPFRFTAPLEVNERRDDCHPSPVRCWPIYRSRVGRGGRSVRRL